LEPKHSPYFFVGINPPLPDIFFSFGNVLKVLLIQIRIGIVAFPLDKLGHDTITIPGQI